MVKAKFSCYEFYAPRDGQYRTKDTSISGGSLGSLIESLSRSLNSSYLESSFSFA